MAFLICWAVWWLVGAAIAVWWWALDHDLTVGDLAWILWCSAVFGPIFGCAIWLRERPDRPARILMKRRG